MGCDIHMVFEIRESHSNDWIGCWASSFGPDPSAAYNPRSRNYRPFANLAGVRGEPDLECGVGYPRGLPDDMSALTRICSDRDAGDAHSHSYMPFWQFFEVYRAIYPNITSSNMDGFLTFAGMFTDENEGEEDGHPEIERRVVFWFDN